MSMNNAIPLDLLFDLSKLNGCYEQLSLLETVPEYTIDEEYLTSVTVAYKWVDESGGQLGTTSETDHPSFAALREHLGSRKYIKIQTGWWNGDVVLKTFLLNGHRFHVGDKFASGGALGIEFKVKRKMEKENGDNATP